MNKKKILVDITTLSDQYKGRGIGIYSKELIKRLFSDDRFEWHAIGFDDVQSSSQFSNIAYHSMGPVTLSNPKNLIRFRTKYMPIIRKVKADLYFATHLERGLPIGIIPTVVSMHDVIPLLTNTFSSKGKVINFLKGLFYKYNISRAQKADAIVSNSYFTKEELVKVGFQVSRIHVVYLGLRDDLPTQSVPRHEVMKHYSISKPYILYYGGFEPNKNVDLLLKAFSLVTKRSDIQLVLADRTLVRKDGKVIIENVLGQTYWEMIKKLMLQKKVVLPGYIDNKDISMLLRNAIAFVHLSGYEGFGLAVLEALACGCPVVAANRSCYPEVLDNAAILVDPENTKQVAREIKRIFEDSDHAETLSKKGKLYINKYSWDKTAEGTINVFNSLLK